MLLTPNFLRLRVFYKMDRYWLATIAQMPVNNPTGAIVGNFKKMMTSNGFNESWIKPTCRFPRFVVIQILEKFNSGAESFCFTEEEVESIRSRRWHSSELGSFFELLEKHNLTSSRLEDWFGHMKINLTNPGDAAMGIGFSDDIELDSASIKIEVKSDESSDEYNGSINVDPIDLSDSSRPIRGVICHNAHETITLPYNNDGQLFNDLAKIIDRAGLSRRYSDTYFVTPSMDLLRRAIILHSLPAMKVDDITRFFGSKRCGTKVETLLEGFRTNIRAENRNEESWGTGKQMIVQLTGNSGTGTPFNFLPPDYILSRAGYLKVLASEALDNRQGIRMMVEIQKLPVDDFGQMIYTFLEDNTRCQILGFAMEDVDKSIEVMKGKP